MADEDFISYFNDVQENMMLARRIQLAAGCLILGLIVGRIIHKKLYVYNTTKLFMWFCICYLVGMFVVLLHTTRMTAGYHFAYDTTQNELDKNNPKQSYTGKQNYLLNILNKMKKDGDSLYYCGIQAFINLYMYDFGYFFAVLVSYNVFCVIKGNYHNFMKSVFKNVKIVLFLIAMLIIYAAPFVLMLIPTDFTSDQYAYSYGPMGFNFQVTINDKTRSGNLLLFAGFVNKPDVNGFQILKLLNVFICPVFMVVVHGIVLILNRRKIETFYQQQYLNSKQRFLIKSGRLGFIVFSIQFIHFFKNILALLIPSFWVNIGINFFFDCYPLFLLYFYLKYTKQKSQELGESSTISQQIQD